MSIGHAKHTLCVLLSAAFGAFCAALSDMLQKHDGASTVSALTNKVGSELNLSIAPTVGLVVFVLIGTCLCLVFRPTSPPAGFYRGASVLAILMTIAPVPPTPSLSSAPQAPNPSTEDDSTPPKQSGAFSLGAPLVYAFAESTRDKNVTEQEIRIIVTSAGKSTVDAFTLTLRNESATRVLARSTVRGAETTFYQTSGVYTIEIRAAGFRPVRDSVSLNGSDRLTLSVELEPLPVGARFLQSLLTPVDKSFYEKEKISPIALACSQEGLFALDASGSLFRIHPDAVTGERVTRVGSVPHQPIDIAIARRDGEEILLVLAFWNVSSSIDQATLTAFTLEGEQLNQWRLQGAFGGLAVNQKTNGVYLAKSRSPQLYDMDFEAGQAPRYLNRVAGAHLLGAIAVDSVRGELLFVDREAGSIIGFSLTDDSQRLITDDVGSPAALAFSHSENRLYVADSEDDRLFAIDLSVDPPRQTLVSADLRFRKLRGLCLAPDSRGAGTKENVWVADREAGAVFGMSPDGEIVSRLP